MVVVEVRTTLRERCDAKAHGGPLQIAIGEPPLPTWSRNIRTFGCATEYYRTQLAILSKGLFASEVAGLAKDDRSVRGPKEKSECDLKYVSF